MPRSPCSDYIVRLSLIYGPFRRLTLWPITYLQPRSSSASFVVFSLFLPNETALINVGTGRAFLCSIYLQLTPPCQGLSFRPPFQPFESRTVYLRYECANLLFSLRSSSLKGKDNLVLPGPGTFRERAGIGKREDNGRHGNTLPYF